MGEHINICKSCGVAFKTKRKRQKYHDYECYVRYKLRTDSDWKRDSAEIIAKRKTRMEALASGRK